MFCSLTSLSSTTDTIAKADAWCSSFLRNLIEPIGLNEFWTKFCVIFIAVALFLSVLILLNYVTKAIILVIVHKIVKKTKNNWDDILYDKKVFHRISQFVPALFVYFCVPLFIPESALAKDIIQKTAIIYFLIIVLRLMYALLNGADEIYFQTIGKNKGTTIRTYTQILKIIASVLVAVCIISIIFKANIGTLFAGMGAMTAVILLIFKDSILGLVGGVQLSTNDMVRIGDWISMPSRNADGTVVEVSLHTVKVQNWDKTITTIPTYNLVSESFSNWRGMEESGGRRIKRSVYIDIESIRFCDEAMIKKLSNFYLLRRYMSAKTVEIQQYNENLNITNDTIVNAQRLTNVGVFRKYLEEYLRDNASISKEMTFIVRQLAPEATGLPLEIYVFSKEQAWVRYEEIQADIFDHIFAILHEFELRAFQNPTGYDFKTFFKEK